WIGSARLGVRLCEAAAVLLLGACAALTNTQVRLWRDTETVFTHDLAVTRNNWVAHHNLALLALSRYETSRHSSIEAQLLSSDSSSAANLPTSRDSRDYLQEVIYHCHAALQAKPNLAEAHITLAKALTEQGQLEKAEAHLEMAVRADPAN